MARGMANGEPIVSQANTDDYRDGHARIFGERGPVRGSWVVHPKTGEIIPAHEYVPEASEAAMHAPIIADRIHEGSSFDAGNGPEDTGSRRKRREFMRRHNLVDASDASPAWYERRRREREASSDRTVDRAMREALNKINR